MGEISPGNRPKTKRGTAKRRASTTSARATQRKMGEEYAKTGYALRQKFTTPDTAELLRRQSEITASLNGPTTAEMADAEQAREFFDNATTKFNDNEVFKLYKAISAGRAIQLIEKLRADTKIKLGRPATLNMGALLVGMLLNAGDNKGCLLSDIANTLYHRLHDRSMCLLGLEKLPEPTADDLRSIDRLRVFKQRQGAMIDKRVERAFNRLTAIVDPSLFPSGRNRSWEQLHQLKRDLTPDEVEQRMNYLYIICNDLLRIPFTMLPYKIRERYDGSCGIDATPVTVHAIGRRGDDVIASVNPDAAYYTRHGDHSEDNNVKKDIRFAFDLNLMVAADPTPGRQYMPAMAQAMTMTRPGEDPSGAARRMLTNLAVAGHQPGYLAGDGLYAQASAAGFHNPARELGWKLVLPILNSQLGIQAVVDGYYYIEGRFYCMSIPQHLINITGDLRDKRITLEEYNQFIEEREIYAAKLHETPDFTKQLKIRLGCPAYGTNPTVMCELKPRSATKDRTTVISGRNIKLREQIYPTEDLKVSPPKACANETITIDFLSHPGIAKYWQDLQFGSQLHTRVYNVLRQSQEGFHGFAKDEAKEALDAKGKRRVHGLAANALMCAILLSAVNRRKVRQFLAKATEDEEGYPYIERRERTGAHGPTFMPPGSPGSRGDPAYIPEKEAA